MTFVLYVTKNKTNLAIRLIIMNLKLNNILVLLHCQGLVTPHTSPILCWHVTMMRAWYTDSHTFTCNHSAHCTNREFENKLCIKYVTTVY